MAAINSGEPLTEQDLKQTLKCKKYTFMGDGILILGVIALAFLSSMEALISFILSSTPHCTDRPFRKKMQAGKWKWK